MPPKGAKASKVVKANKNGKVVRAAKGNGRRTKLVHAVPVVETDTILEVEKVSPQLDSLLSVELVQTAVAAIFFDIIWLRKVFPDGKIWQGRVYDPMDPNNSYDAYVEGTDFVPKQNDYRNWHVPKRGVDARVDKLINTLASCAKEPIERHWLKKLQLCFHFADDDVLSEANLIESYSLTFEHYEGRISPQISTSGENIPSDERPLTLHDGRQTLQSMIDRLFQTLYDSNRYGQLKRSPLPAKFRMLFLAEYNDTAPVDYQPTYFKPGDAVTSSILNLCPGSDEHVLDTGHHVVSAGLLLPGTEESQIQSPDIMNNSRGLTASQDSIILDRSRSAGIENRPQSKLDLHLQAATFDEGTQREAVNQLQDAGLSRLIGSATQDTQQSRPQFSVPQPSIEAPHGPIVPPYTQDIMNHVQKRLLKPTSTHRGDDLDEPQGIDYKGGSTVIKCECGCQARHIDMILCVECQCLQHSECYGYLNQKHPTNHLCYPCLADLRPEERPHLNAASALCVDRFILAYLREEQIVSYEALAEYSERSLLSITSIVERLSKSGLVQMMRKHQTTKTRTARYVGNDNDLSKKYFRPQDHINSLFASIDQYTDNTPRASTMIGREKTRTPEVFRTPQRVNHGRSQRHGVDDDTTQGEPSPQSIIRTPIPTDVDSPGSRSDAQGDLNDESGRPTSKRAPDFDSPEAVKRVRMSQTSPFWFGSA